MKKILIQVTNKYPFGTGENFSENELQHFSKTFDKVLIIPTSLDEELIKTTPRTVPSNVEIFKEISPLQQLRQGSAQIFKLPKRGIVRSGIYSAKQVKSLFKNPKHFAYDAWFDLQTETAYPQIKKWLNETGLFEETDGEYVTIYATWFHLNAAVAAKIKQDFFKGNINYLVSRAHRYDLYVEDNPRKYLPARVKLLNEFDKVYPVSEDGVQYLRKDFPNHSSKIVVRRLGAKIPSQKVTAARSPLHIFSCSWIKEVKRLDLLILALKRLEELDVEFHWYHIGDGEEAYSHKILTFAEENLSKNNYTFLGNVPNLKVIPTYAKHRVSVVVNVSSSEGVPVSLMEAISVGIPIIATDVGGSRELFQETMFNGLLKSDPSPNEVAEKFTDLASLPESQYAKYCLSTLEAWSSYWNVETNLKEFADELFKGKHRKSLM